MKFMIAATAATLALVSTGLRAQTTIDFQDQTPGSCWGIGHTMTSDGYDFRANDTFFACNPGVLQHNTTLAIIDANSRSIVTMSKNGGGTFSFNSFFAGGRTGDFDADTPVNNFFSVATGINIVGNVFGGGTVTTSVVLDSNAPYDWSEFFLPSSFTNLTSVEMTAQGGTNPEFVMDDFQVNGQFSEVSSTPEPSTYSMLALGLGGLMMVRRRRRA